MSRRSGSVPSLMIGVAIGVTAWAIARRRASMALAASPAEPRLAGGRTLAVSGDSAMQTMLTRTGETIRALSAVAQDGSNGLAAQLRRYATAARARVDVAIAEGQVAAAQTRRDLEARLAAAKVDPGSARTAFD